MSESFTKIKENTSSRKKVLDILCKVVYNIAYTKEFKDICSKSQN